jgi:hypothetical protein
MALVCTHCGNHGRRMTWNPYEHRQDVSCMACGREEFVEEGEGPSLPGDQRAMDFSGPSDETGWSTGPFRYSAGITEKRKEVDDMEKADAGPGGRPAREGGKKGLCTVEGCTRAKYNDTRCYKHHVDYLVAGGIVDRVRYMIEYTTGGIVEDFAHSIKFTPKRIHTFLNTSQGGYLNLITAIAKRWPEWVDYIKVGKKCPVAGGEAGGLSEAGPGVLSEAGSERIGTAAIRTAGAMGGLSLITAAQRIYEEATGIRMEGPWTLNQTHAIDVCLKAVMAGDAISAIERRLAELETFRRRMLGIVEG